jgi:hypothetical protein
MSSQPPNPPPPPGSFDVPVAGDSPTSFSAMPPAMDASAQAGEVEPAGRHTVGTPRWIVLGGIWTSVAISLLAISILYYRWYKAEDFESTIVVWAPAEWKGATVQVNGANLPGNELTRDLDDEDHLLIRFHVPPGAYTVRVHRKGQMLAQQTSRPPLTPRMIWWPFRISPAATMSAR